jgi:hypothetical protein
MSPESRKSGGVEVGVINELNNGVEFVGSAGG